MYPEQFLTDSFVYILNMSITGSYIILAVMLARLLLKKAPKKISYILWSAPFIRLVSPFTLKSKISLFNLGIFNSDVYSNAIHEYVPLSYDSDYTPNFATGITQGQSLIPSTFEAFSTTPENSANPLQVILFVLACVWIVGMAVMLIYAVASFISTKKKLSTATVLEKGIYESESITSPFVIGILRPKIYLPYGLGDEEREYIILHEKTHIKSLDHFAKIFAFFVLTVHWFNPLCYLAFTLMSRDMEMACDEAVLKNNEKIKKDYASSLLSFASNKKLPAPSPLCFGESGVKQRIKNALSWKKPHVWVVAISLLFLGVFWVSAASNPQTSVFFTKNPEGPLNDAVIQMIFDENSSSYHQDLAFCHSEGHIIYGYTENDDEVTVYGYMSYSEMGFMNGFLTDYMGSGASMPFVATFYDKDGFYKLKEVKYPQDGMNYGKSIRAMFPAEYERRAIFSTDKDRAYMEQQQLAYAEAALREEGINCEIITTPDVPVMLLNNYDVWEKISTSGVVNTRHFPDDIGCHMYKHGDNYIVYETRVDEEKGRYYLAEYKNVSSDVEAYAFDLEGNYVGKEVISVVDFFSYELPEDDSELYYLFDTNTLTTNAILLEEGETLPTEVTSREPTTRKVTTE